MSEPEKQPHRIKAAVILAAGVVLTFLWIRFCPSHFAIIRVDEEKVDPAYVLWILRQPSTLKQIYQNASGTTAFGTISSNFFGELPINNLPIEKQRIIGELLKLSEKEQILLSNLMKAKSDLNKIALQQAYKNFNRGRK